MMVDETTTSCLRGAGIERSCPAATLVILARHIVAFYFAIAAHVASQHKMRHVPSECEETLRLKLHPGHLRVAER